jgi:hypothetical protein
MTHITCPHCNDTYPTFDAAHVCSKGPYAPRLKPKMNERIDKLFEQALEEFKAENKYATIIVPDPLKEKFAELIVRDCMDVVDGYTKSRTFDTHYDAVEQIEALFGIKHFGVEE